MAKVNLKCSVPCITLRFRRKTRAVATALGFRELQKSGWSTLAKPMPCSASAASPALQLAVADNHAGLWSGLSAATWSRCCSRDA